MIPEKCLFIKLKMRVCKINNCNKNYLAKGYCNKHYQRYRKYGNPEEPSHKGGWNKKIPIEKICEICNTKFYIKPSLKNRKYCCFKCYKISSKGKRKLPLGFKHSLKTKEFFSLSRKGNNNPCWRGGRIKRRGYNFLYKPEHPFCTKQGYIAEHRIIIEKQIGRYLYRWEVCHHINKIKDDNRPQNLMVFISAGKHTNFEKGLKVKNGDIIFDGRNAHLIPKNS